LTCNVSCKQLQIYDWKAYHSQLRISGLKGALNSAMKIIPDSWNKITNSNTAQLYGYDMKWHGMKEVSWS
jgi:hypothetical protein